jgi:uncharacterized Zn finger protein
MMPGLDRIEIGCRSCGSNAIEIRGRVTPEAIVRCGGCGGILSTWRSYLKRTAKSASALREGPYVKQA